MTSQTSNETGDDTDAASGDSEDESTQPADGDVVNRIRAHAAEMRSDALGASTDVGPLKVWTPESDERAAAPEAKPVQASEPRVILSQDDTVVFARYVPEAEDEVDEPQHASPSLIEGVTPPDTSVSFWDDRPFRASGIDAPSRRYRQGGTVPLWGWVAAVMVFIVVASLAISWVLATGFVAAGAVTP